MRSTALSLLLLSFLLSTSCRGRDPASVAPTIAPESIQPRLSFNDAGSCPPPLLPPDRMVAWKPGVTYNGGIPTGYPSCTTLTPLGGGMDDSVQINNAVASCAAGTVINLSAGTFLLTANPGSGYSNNFILINKGLILRGAGAGVTFISKPQNDTPISPDSGSASPIDVWPSISIGPSVFGGSDGDPNCNGLTAYNASFMQLLTADTVIGSTTAVVQNGSIFSAGQFVIMDETSGAIMRPDLIGLSTSVLVSDNYLVQWDQHNPSVITDDGIAYGLTPGTTNNYAGNGSGTDEACWYCRQDRPQNEIKEITAVKGNVITFSSPIHNTYRTSHYAELNTMTGGSYTPVTHAGVENLTILYPGGGGVNFQNSAYCWAKNIEVGTWYNGGVNFGRAFRDEVRDSYIHTAANSTPGGISYSVNMTNAATDILVEDNIVLLADKMIVARNAGTGSVVAYNYMDDGYIAYDQTFIEIGVNGSHDVGSNRMLFEGNQSFNLDSDDTHGASTYHTFLRNWAKTYRTPFISPYDGAFVNDISFPSTHGPKRAVGLMAYSYKMSFIGNILGENGITTVANGFVDSECNPLGQAGMIWMLGWQASGNYAACDLRVPPTTIRDGNWDWLLGQQTWLTNQPQSVPNSYYLSSAPPFFTAGGWTWPWVYPETGITLTLPAWSRWQAGHPNVLP